jgi:SEC-C motif domain protein
MRSRYSAFVRRDEAYLLRSWHPNTRPKRVTFDDDLRWTGLDVIEVHGGGVFDSKGTVRFEARYVDASTPAAMRENSRFVREGGAWLYVGAQENSDRG